MSYINGNSTSPDKGTEGNFLREVLPWWLQQPPFFVKIDFITKYIDTFLPEWVTIGYDHYAQWLLAGSDS